MLEALEIRDIYLNSHNSIHLAFDSVNYGNVISYCPFCGKQIKLED